MKRILSWLFWIFLRPGGLRAINSDSPLCGTLNVYREQWYPNATFLPTVGGLNIHQCLDKCCKTEDCTAIMFTGFLIRSTESNCYLFSCYNDSCNLLAWKPADTGLITILIARNDAYLQNLHNFSSPTTSLAAEIESTTAPVAENMTEDGILMGKTTVWNNLTSANNTEESNTEYSVRSQEPLTRVVEPKNKTDLPTAQIVPSKYCAPYSLLGLLGFLLVICVAVIVGLLASLITLKRKHAQPRYKSRSYNDHLDAYYNSVP